MTDWESDFDFMIVSKLNGERTRYRHEYKYHISDTELALIKSQLSPIVQKDRNVGEKGFYNISSLYFDDIYNSCLFDNENGYDPREKYRIRIYNHNVERISLERKRKERGKTLKESCILTREQAEILCAGDPIRDLSSAPSLLVAFSEKIISQNLHPVTIVEYDRIPYVYGLGNVRITFDTNLSSSRETDKFLTGAAVKRPIMPKGKELLEVKYDEFLPDYIYRALQIENLTQTSFSKYYLCREINTIQ